MYAYHILDVQCLIILIRQHRRNLIVELRDHDVSPTSSLLPFDFYISLTLSIDTCTRIPENRTAFFSHYM
jgi:hypothetical protein